MVDDITAHLFERTSGSVVLIEHFIEETVPPSAALYLLTEDLQDGQDLDGVTVIDPFLHSPDEILNARR